MMGFLGAAIVTWLIVVALNVLLADDVPPGQKQNNPISNTLLGPVIGLIYLVVRRLFP